MAKTRQIRVRVARKLQIAKFNMLDVDVEEVVEIEDGDSEAEEKVKAYARNCAFLAHVYDPEILAGMEIPDWTLARIESSMERLAAMEGAE